LVSYVRSERSCCASLAAQTTALVVSRFEVFLWTKEAASLLRRAPAVSRRMLCKGRRVARVDYEEADLFKDLVS